MTKTKQVEEAEEYDFGELGTWSMHTLIAQAKTNWASNDYYINPFIEEKYHAIYASLGKEYDDISYEHLPFFSRTYYAEIKRNLDRLASIDIHKSMLLTSYQKYRSVMKEIHTNIIKKHNAELRDYLSK